MEKVLATEAYTDVFIARFENVAGITARAQEHLISVGISEDVAAICMVALSEALNNVVEHTYAGQPDGQAELNIHINASQIMFQVRDQGLAPPDGLFNAVTEMPDPHSLPEGGWGLALIDTVMDDVYYSYKDGHNQLDLIKEIPS